MIAFRVLGLVDLCSSDGREIRSVLSQPKRLALLSWLVLERPRGFQSRDAALALFWPEHDDVHARRALNRAIYWLRQSLGDGVLLSRGDGGIGVATERCWTDVEAFESAVANARFAEAAELYRGDLLPGLFVSDAVGFEHWLDGERHRLRSLAHRAGRALTEEEAAHGNLTGAAHWARWTLERSPCDEPGLRRLMSILDAAGDRAGAVREYDEFAHRLETSLELTPSPETKELLAAIRARNHAVATEEARIASVRVTENPPQASDRQTGVRHVDTDSAGLREADSRPTAAAPMTPVPRRARLARAFAVAIVVLAAAVPAYHAIREERAAAPPRVIVHPFENRTGDSALDPLVQLTSDWIAYGLSEAGIATVYGGPDANSRRLSTLFSSLRRGTNGALPTPVIRGAIYRAGRSVRFEASVHGESMQRAWTLQSVTAVVDSPEPAIREIRDRATGASAALLNPRFASWLPLGTRTPPTFEAFKEFEHGDELMRSRRTAEALRFFHRASMLDTTFTWSRLEIAAAYMKQLDYRRADSIIASLDRQHDQLTPLERSWLNYMLGTISENVDQAALAMAKAADIARDRFLSLRAETLRWLHRPAEIVKLLRDAGPGGPYHEGKPLYWSRIAEAYHQLGDYRRELAVARRVRRYQPAESEGLWLEIRALAGLGRMSEVPTWLRAAESFLRVPSRSPGSLMLDAAQELRAHAHEEAATTVLEHAINWYRGLPPEESIKVENRFHLANALYLAGQLDAAEPLFQQLALDDPDFLPEYEGSLGAIAARRGDRATAEAFLARLEHNRFAMNPPPKYPLFAQARIVGLLGDSERAVRLLREAIGGQGRDFHMVADFEPLKSNPAFRDFIRPRG